MSDISPTINSERLKRLFDSINKFGLNVETGGYNRIGFSQSDLSVRKWFTEQMTEAGLTVHADAAGNLFGRLGDADKPCIMAGSHLDTVPEGGAFDGALGVAVALECARSIKDAGIKLTIPLVVVATSEEEGRFGGMLGSQTISGQLPPGWVETAADAEGVTLREAMTAQGYAPEALADAAWQKGSIRSFLELHIEQGPVLEGEKLSVGIVEGISGVLVLGVNLKGEANHSGTTPMHLRADAFTGLATIGAAISGVIDRLGGDQSRITIGKVDIKPNFPHTIPGEADFTIIIRDTSRRSHGQLTQGHRNSCRNRRRTQPPFLHYHRAQLSASTGAGCDNPPSFCGRGQKNGHFPILSCHRERATMRRQCRHFALPA